MKNNLPAYHETLSQALSALGDHLAARQIVSTDTTLEDRFQYDGVPYGTSKEAHFPITIKGKNTRKFGHVTVWRDERGKYEINFYAL